MKDTPLSERQLVAVLATANASSIDGFIQAIDRISSGEDPEEMILGALAMVASATQSGRLQSAVQGFGASTQLLGANLLDGFLKLKEAVEDLFMPAQGQA
jgi:hypothetical protein